MARCGPVSTSDRPSTSTTAGNVPPRDYWPDQTTPTRVVVSKDYLDSARFSFSILAFEGLWGNGLDLFGIDTEFAEPLLSGLSMGSSGLGIATGVVALPIRFGLVLLSATTWRKIDRGDEDVGGPSYLFQRQQFAAFHFVRW